MLHDFEELKNKPDHDILITLVESHQNLWQVTADELSKTRAEVKDIKK